VNQTGARKPPWAPLIAVMGASGLFTLGEGSLNVVLSPYLELRGLRAATIGFVVASYSVAALLSRFAAGSVYQRRTARIIIPLGCLASASSYFLLPITSATPLLSGLIALNGIGFALVSTGALAAIVDLRPTSSSSTVMAWYTGAIGGGYAVAGFLGGALGDALGPAGAIRVLTVIPLLAGVVMLAALWRFGAGTAAESEPGRKRFTLAGFREAGPLVWLAFAIGLHINLLGGVLITYFPLYGLAVGLTLTQIGILAGVHSSVGSLIRFATPLLFAQVDHRRLDVPLVLLGGIAVAAMASTAQFGLLLACWLTVGLSRGVLRVSSAAVAMESGGEDERSRGAASGIYLAGLDLGRIVGPLVGGVVAQTAGLRATFLVAGLAFPLAFLVLRKRLDIGTDRR
jgi:MFS family permease